MAKQNVTFIERHLEKFVIGVCGATLLAIMTFYLIDTPNKVIVDGQSLAPKTFYRLVEEEAGQVVNRMKNARPETPDPTQNLGTPNLVQNPSPYAGAGLPVEFSVVFVSPSPAIPDIVIIVEKEQVELAEIVAPIKPVLTTGRSTGKLPVTEEVDIALDSNRPPAGGVGDSLEPTKDYVWATVITAIDRREQRAIFESKGYSSSRLALVVADVEAERQELLPSGQWSEAEIIHSYAPTVYIPANSVKVVEQDGEFIVSPDQMSLIESHHRKFASDTQQADLLRPSFVDFLDEQWRWSVKTLPDVELDWADFNIELPDDDDKNSRRRAGRLRNDETVNPARNRPAAGAAGNAEDARIAEVRATLKEAETAIAEKKYLEAEELLLSIKAPGESASPQLAVPTKKAAELLESIAAEIDEARVAQAQKLRRKEEASKFTFGPDIDPVWINDITVTPGKLYRYRVRLIALNQYAGLPAELKNPDDAAVLARPGKWSDWSDPIAVERDRHLFFNGIDGDNKSAKVEINQVVSGKWKSFGAKLAIGQPLISGTGRSALNYNGIIVDIDEHRNYRNAKENIETPALVLVNSYGEVEEHLFIEDQTKKRDFQKKKKDEEDRDRDRPAIGRPAPVGRPLPAPARPTRSMREERGGGRGS